VKYQNGSTIKVPSAKQIRKMSMGALKDIFCALVKQNQLEAHRCAALTALNLTAPGERIIESAKAPK
jgi:hypothetical protein